MSAAVRTLVADLGGQFLLDVRWRDAQGNPLNLSTGVGEFALLERSRTVAVLHVYPATGTADGWLHVARPAAEVATWPERCSYRLSYTPTGGQPAVVLVGQLQVRGPDDV